MTAAAPSPPDKETRPGDDVAVRTADGLWLLKVATTGCIDGGDFPVVWAAWHETPDEDSPWPVEDVAPANDVPDALTRDAYRDRS